MINKHSGVWGCPYVFLGSGAGVGRRKPHTQRHHVKGQTAGPGRAGRSVQRGPRPSGNFIHRSPGDPHA